MGLFTAKPYKMDSLNIAERAAVSTAMEVAMQLDTQGKVTKKLKTALRDFLAEEFPPDTLLFSLMSQYTPMPGLERFPELQRRVDAETNDNLVSYMRRRGLDGYWQEPSSATEDMIPAFDGTGV